MTPQKRIGPTLHISQIYLCFCMYYSEEYDACTSYETYIRTYNANWGVDHYPQVPDARLLVLGQDNMVSRTRNKITDEERNESILNILH